LGWGEGGSKRAQGNQCLAAFQYQEAEALRKKISIVVIGFLVFAASPLNADELVGLGELDRLIQLHLPKKYEEGIHGPSIKVKLVPKGEETVFTIPGFDVYGCGECHQAEQLLGKSIDRMRKSLNRLTIISPELPPPPLKQFIIQSWSDEWLRSGQFAHTTFDTIRIFPAAILVDSKVYGNATHLHESLHLTQSFLGMANELEAYGLNVRSDPRFLILNFPYFSDTVTTFFIPELPDILNRFFAREVKQEVTVPQEVQWFLMAFEDDTLKKIAAAIKKMETVLQEVSRLNRKYPIESAYLGEQTRAASLLLDIAAVKVLPLPPLDLDPASLKEAFSILEIQFNKLDNTRLGYRIDRKHEALMMMTYHLRLKDSAVRLGIYFRFLRQRFIGADGEVKLVVPDAEDLNLYIKEKRRDISKMSDSLKLTPIEKAGALRMLKSIPTTTASY
jgi:hypothetical protein